ncbi:hypothetical protein V6Z12_D10G177500 [Gossypium hirsutum]
MAIESLVCLEIRVSNVHVPLKWMNKKFILLSLDFLRPRCF